MNVVLTVSSSLTPEVLVTPLYREYLQAEQLGRKAGCGALLKDCPRGLFIFK